MARLPWWAHALVTNSQTKSIVHAFKDKEGKVGESKGQEICTAPYYNSHWDYVIRWTGK